MDNNNNNSSSSRTPTKYKRLEEVFAERFRACEASEIPALRDKFATALQPLFVSFDDSVLIAQNRLPEAVSLEVDLLSALYTNTNNFVVKYVGATGFSLTYAGGGIASPHWFDLTTLEAAREAALFATLAAGNN